ncbi:Eukaryotic translation initiation factor 5A-1 [Capsicum baccatum]|uniref:Eukaryotic translation initiation factor 5A-1 n=1 Tax=Capsicum baccatum TaxID=33114 RepID=A0A2G2VBQ5_CAPBA|nr:Eukaryotic translation initiation factor 5A-1 [Capsicum baccatum]
MILMTLLTSMNPSPPHNTSLLLHLPLLFPSSTLLNILIESHHSLPIFAPSDLATQVIFNHPTLKPASMSFKEWDEDELEGDITFEVCINDDAIDHMVVDVANKKLAETMQKDITDLQRFVLMVSPQSGKKWIADELFIVAKSKEVAGDMISKIVIYQVVEVSTSKTGKHGHAKCHFVAIDIFTRKKLEVPRVNRTDYHLIDISEDGFASLLTENGNTKDDLWLPTDDTLMAQFYVVG